MNPLPANLVRLLGQDAVALLPEMVLAGLLLLVLLADLLLARRAPWAVPLLAAAGLTWILAACADWIGPTYRPLFGGMLLRDGPAQWMQLLGLGAGLFTVLLGWTYPPLQAMGRRRDVRYGSGEFFLLVLGLVLGVQFVAMAQNLLLVYLSLELTSLSGYVLAGYFRQGRATAEAAVKYVLFGAASSALMLYGMTLLYGLTGTLYLPQALQAAAALPLLAAVLLVLVGAAFKMAAAPFHFWAPDVYQGSAAPVAALLATASKLAGFVLVLRLGLALQAQQGAAWVAVAAALALLSMTFGSFGALRQTDYRRLLAYSGVAQAGFVLMGAVAGAGGWAGFLFYLLAYVVLTLGAFAAGSLLAEAAGSTDAWQWRGLGLRHPWLSAAFAVLMVGLTGLPPTVGFIAKLNVFLPVYQAYAGSGSAWLLALLLAGLLYTVVSLYFYLRPVAWLFFGAAGAGAWRYVGAWDHRVRLAMVLACALASVWLGVRYFDVLLGLAQTAAGAATGR